LAVAAAIAGPAILVLLPVWLMGAWLAHSGRYETRWAIGLACAGFVLPLMLIVLIKLNEVDTLVQSTLFQTVPAFWRIGKSQRFVTDYLIGAALCLHIAAFSSLPAAVQAFFVRHQRALAGLAGFSFTLYLFHRPMTQLLGHWYPQPAGAIWQTTGVALGIPFVCWAISFATEKQLPRWRRGFARLLVR